MAPKSLLRHPAAASDPGDLSSGSFQPVLVEARDGAARDGVRRLVICSGKVYADLVSSEDFAHTDGLTVMRVEQLYPFPAKEIAESAAGMKGVSQVAWLQEEPENRGAWSFVAPRLASALGRQVEYVGRPAMPSPAEGAHWVHKISQDRLVKRALGVAA
jgi:2-oxoglutarate dehydrogenase E1 component